MEPLTPLEHRKSGFFTARASVLLTTPLYLLLLVALILPSGCMSVPKVKPAQAGPVFFPAPPEQARVQYLGSISGQADLPTQRGKFADFVLGPEPVMYTLAKPNNAILVGNRLYVCDTVLNTVLVLNLETGEVRPFAGDAANGKIKQPNCLTRDDQGNFYIADKIRQAVLVYGPDEQFHAAWGRPGQCDPVDVAVGDKVLYVCDIKDNEIEVWDRASGQYQRSLGKKGNQPGQFYMPTHLALDTSGSLFVTDTGNFRVQKLSPDGQPLMQFGGHGDTLGKFAWPKGMAVDGHNRIYVVDSRFFNVQIFDPQGRLLLFFGGPGPNGGFVEIPSGINLEPWPADVAWLNSRLAPGFDPEYLAIVVSQQGEHFINFFAVARDTAAVKP